MIDVTDVPPADAGLGAAVTLIGRDGAEQITVDDLAGWAGTLSYEILCGISKRVPRILRDAPVTSRRRPESRHEHHLVGREPAGALAGRAPAARACSST